MAHSIAGLIPLDPAFLRDTDPTAVDRRLEHVVRSNRFEVVREASAFRVLGPVVPYHAIDPYLPAALHRLHPDLRMDQAQSFRMHAGAFDLCLEDSWSGYFVARWLQASPTADDIVFIHLDHHTDMMSSLLERRGDRLVDPTDDRTFDPRASDDWQKAIASGAVGIGSFVTTLFELPHVLHVRHINNYATSDYTPYRVTRQTRTYPEIPGRTFAAIRKRRDDPADAVGTYKGGCDARRVLDELPRGRIVVHIDLDYLMNDFNGNARGPDWSPSPEARVTADDKLGAFFAALRAADVRVDRWIVATSPGFCSAYHWPWLLERIERGIAQMAPVAVRAPLVVPGGVPSPKADRR